MNVEMRRRTWTTLEFAVPSGCVQADLRDAHMAALRHYHDATGLDRAALPPDDAFRVEARDDEIVFVITLEEKS